MDNGFVKNAGLEDSGVTDPRSGLPIRVSTTVRMKYRRYFGKEWGDRRDVLYGLHNPELNEVIAQDFRANAQNIVHMFLGNQSDIASRQRTWIEIRREAASSRPFHFFFSIIRPGSIDIIGTTTRYFRPSKPRIIDPKGL
jgi:hypothetical protein